MNVAHSFVTFACLLPLVSGCMPTLGSDFMGKSHLGDGTYLDLNTIPEQTEAQKSRGLHTGDEQLARQQDLQNLEKKRLEIQTVGQESRQKALISSPDQEKKETHDANKSRS